MYKVDINLKVKESFLFIQTFFSLKGENVLCLGNFISIHNVNNIKMMKYSFTIICK